MVGQAKRRARGLPVPERPAILAAKAKPKKVTPYVLVPAGYQEGVDAQGLRWKRHIFTLASLTGQALVDEGQPITLMTEPICIGRGLITPGTPVQ